jgi:hypothetical protein
MPNWVYNTITIEGTPEQVKEIAEYVKSDDSVFDFNKIIPAPEGCENDSDFDWYSWNCENWGTKWNAGCSSKSDDVFEFQTAWSPPEPIFDALSEKFPNIEIKVYWEEEQGFGEMFTIQDGIRCDVESWDAPEHHYYEDGEDEITILEVAGFHPEYDDGPGFYREGSSRRFETYDDATIKYKRSQKIKKYKENQENG